MAGKSLNKVQLLGRLGKDADLRYTPNGRAVATFSLATSERYKSGDSDEWQEKTEWHNIVIWGKMAESLAEYLLKGKRIYLEGQLQTRSWDGQDGNKHYMTEIVARDIILLGGRGESSSDSFRPPHPADNFSDSAPTHTGAAPAAPTPAAPTPAAPTPDAPAPAAPAPDAPATAAPVPPDQPEDDIPF